MTTSPAPYADAEYQRNRKLLLAGDPVCAICGAEPATNVDHVVPLSQGGDHSLANLRPTGRCNFVRSAKSTQAKRAMKRAAIANSDGAAGIFSGAPQPAAQRPRPLSQRNVADRANTGLAIGDIPVKGRKEPRLQVYRTGSSSYGPGVTRWAAEHMTFPLMGWNKFALSKILATKDSRLLHRQALVSVSRQNSKTTMMEALVGWYLTEYAERIARYPVTVGWMSHDLKLAEQAFVFLARLLEPHTSHVLYSFGRQRLEMQNGSLLTVVSNSMGAGHGWSFDLVVCDESWRVKPEAIGHGILPAMRARPDPLLIQTSTAGDEDSLLLKQWRERGLSLIESGEDAPYCFLEWSPPSGVDLLVEPEWWAWANPCLGVTLTAETLLDEYRAPDRNGFLRGALNTWIQSQESWLEPGWWARCKVRTMPEPEGGVVAAEVSQAGTQFVATRAWQHNGVTYVQPLVSTGHEDVLWSFLEAAYPDIDALAITPTLQPHLPKEMERKAVSVGIKELARSVPLVRGMVAAGQVAHPGNALLDEHVGRAVQTKSAGLSTASSSGPIEAARTLVWSVALASRPAWRRKPSIGYSSAAG